MEYATGLQAISSGQESSIGGISSLKKTNNNPGELFVETKACYDDYNQFYVVSLSCVKLGRNLMITAIVMRNSRTSISFYELYSGSHLFTVKSNDDNPISLYNLSQCNILNVNPSMEDTSILSCDLLEAYEKAYPLQK